MIEYPDHGYTPANFKVLVAATKMSNVDFIKQFSMTRAMFYRYRKGHVTMQHKDWKLLTTLVENYLKKEAATK